MTDETIAKASPRMLIAFPWLSLKECVSAGGLELLPWERDKQTEGWTTEQHATAERLLGGFCVTPGQKIRAATLVRRDGESLFAFVDEHERAAFWKFREQVAFSGLAAREFFTDRYVSSTNFVAIVESFTDPQGRVTLFARRRDGYSDTRVDRGALLQVRPLEAQVFGETDLDVELLQALSRADSALDAGDYEALAEGLVLFNQASTDSGTVAEQTEFVLMAAAFQRLLKAKSNAKDMAAKFGELLSPTESIDWPSARRWRSENPKHHHAGSLRAAWMSDFYGMRGNLAHGVLGDRGDFVWSLREHLLLGAFAFPLVVKEVLQKAKIYGLTKEDEADIHAFEQLADAPDLFQETKDGSWPWREILDSQRLEGAFIRSLQRVGPLT